MKIVVSDTPEQLGKRAAAVTAAILRDAIAEKGSARVVLSTGASQFTTLDALVREDVDWTRVDMFHLDEYVDLPDTHIASFRKYLRERFVSKVPLRAAHFVDGTEAGTERLTAELRAAPVDVGLIGVGENAHIAFNDPPADFDTRAAYIRVALNDACKRQQVREGWFATPADVPQYAMSMTVYQIMQCKAIVSAVPYAVKANAIHDMLAHALTPDVPATMLKTHPRFTLFVDADSFAKARAAGLGGAYVQESKL